MRSQALVVAAALATTSATAFAANWYDGSPSRVQHTCDFGLSSQVEDLVWTWVGFQDVDGSSGPRLPTTNETYYVRVVLGGIGCSGAWVHPELKLPKGTSLAITTQTPIRCFVDKPNQPPHQPLGGSDCPTSAPPGIYPGGSGFFAFYPPNGQGYWPLPLGYTLYIEVPVTSTMALSGIATNDYAVAAVNILDNNPGGGNPPWDNPNPVSSGPWQGVFVTATGALPSPYVSFADTSATPATTTASTDFVIHNVGCAAAPQSALQGDLLPVAVAETTEAFMSGSCIAGCCSGTCATTDTATYRFLWNMLVPDTEYKWRGYFNPLVVPGGCARDVADAQTNATSPQWAYFKTLPTTPPATAYSLLLHSSAGGKLAATPGPPSNATRYQPGTTVTVTPQPDTGFMLDKLTVDGVVTTAPAMVVMSQDRAVEASFVMASPSGDNTGGGGGGGGCCDAGSSTPPAIPLAMFVLAALLARRRAQRYFAAPGRRM